MSPELTTAGSSNGRISRAPRHGIRTTQIRLTLTLAGVVGVFIVSSAAIRICRTGTAGAEPCFSCWYDAKFMMANIIRKKPANWFSCEKKYVAAPNATTIDSNRAVRLPNNDAAMYRNLRNVCKNYAAFGVRRFLVARAVENPAATPSGP